MTPDELIVHKVPAYLPLSVEMALDYGLISEEDARASGWTPTPLPPIPLRVRLRWRWQAARERIGRKVGGWIAGIDLSEGEDD